MSYNTSNLTVTLIGSFRKDVDKLQRLFEDTKNRFTLLSPISIDFTNEEDGFVKTKDEMKSSIKHIEQKHLEAIKASDFVLLHAPSGYVGVSAATEIGFAYALGIPVFADEKPTDKTIETFISGYITPDKEVELAINPGKGVDALQLYYKRVAKRRGWDDETPKDTLILIIEEIGELARAIRKIEGIKRDGNYNDDSLSEELADVQLYLVHLANVLNINLGDAVSEKEMKNQARFLNRS
jgi:NTP pyrophosphatase (non-canonical NTP hydrolase)